MKKIRLPSLSHMKSQQEKITALTCYDASMIQCINDAHIEVVLVGDSLGQVIQGQDYTIGVSVEDIAYHTRCVSKKNTLALIMADLPFLSYTSFHEAIENSKILMQAGAEMIKIEGGKSLAPLIKKLSSHGVPICAHIGLTPQYIHQLGGYKIQGRDDDQAEQLLEDAQALEKAGAQLLVLECVPRSLAKKITENLAIPTIGIGAGSDCDGQILVCYDMLGITSKKFTFAKNFLSSSIRQAFSDYHHEVKNKIFPAFEHGFD